MKQVKGKYIRITEKRLQQIIKDTVEKHVSMIMEYAMPRAKFIDNTASLCYQIIENWCLVHYCTITRRTALKAHWQQELSAHMNNIGRDEIKNNNSYEARLKAVIEAFELKSLPSNVERIIRIVRKKFKDEQIRIDTDEFMQCMLDCHNAIKDIIDKIANGDDEIIDNYIQTI